MDKEAILNKLFGISVDAPPLTPLDKGECLKAMDEYAASLLKENETFKDAMIERNDRCNELTKELEYWKKFAQAAEVYIEIRHKWNDGATANSPQAKQMRGEINGSYAIYSQLKSQQK